MIQAIDKYHKGQAVHVQRQWQPRARPSWGPAILLAPVLTSPGQFWIEVPFGMHSRLITAIDEDHIKPLGPLLENTNARRF